MAVEIGRLPRKAPSSVFLTGDTRFTRDYWKATPFSDAVCQYIESAGYSITNLEASMETDTPLVKTGPTISTPPSTHQLLSRSGFDGVSLANNHTMDYGSSGLQRTLDTCDQYGLDTVGAGNDAGRALDPIQCEIDGTSIGIFAVTEHEALTATDTTPGTCWARAPGISSSIRRRSEDLDVTIVVAHGGVEFVPLPPTSWRRVLRTFAEQTVDIVVGHHPHCPQAWEVVGETPILYSLGNFLMYSDAPASRRSYGVSLAIGDDQIESVRIVPLGIRNGRVEELAPDDDPGYYEYLRETAAVLDGDEEYAPYWQELAVRLFEGTYNRRFADYGKGHLSALVDHPIRELDRLTRGCVGTCADREKAADILDYVGNESHRDVVSTALNVDVGNLADERTEAVADDIDDWYPYYDGRSTRSRIEAYRSRLKTVVRRLT